MKNYRIPANALIYLLLSQLLLLIPLFRYLPIWILFVWAACGFWHWRVQQQKARNPGKLALFTVIALVMAAQIANFYSNPLGLEPSVSLLLLATSLKLLEIQSARDVWVVCYMGFLTAAVQFLFDQDMTTASWIFFVCLPVLILTLFSLQSDGQLGFRTQFASVAKLLVISLPMMLVVFLVFPRFGPLWSVPLPGKESRTGLSDTVRPGSFAKLGKSTELAFRVEFKDRVPKADQLYWRSIVFTDLKIDTWRPAGKYWRSDPSFMQYMNLSELTPDIEYEITIQPNYEHWLYALDVSKLQQGDGVRTSAQLTFYRESPNMSAFAYKGIAATAGYYPEELSQAEKKYLTKYAPLFNRQTQDLVNSWVAANPEPRAVIDKALQLFANNFSYTLEPAPLGRHSVDDFIFSTKEGFCEHYASAFAQMMRMAGIPARLIGGYQGGEWNKSGNYLLVHQSDAHAWVEVWLEGQGWTRVDPTSVVSPARISDGIAEVLRNSDAYLSDNLFSMRKFDLLNDLRYWMDDLDYQWQRWVIGYRGDRQVEVLTRLIGAVSLERILMFIIGAFVLILGAAWLFISFEHLRHRKPAVDRAWDKFRKALAKAGYNIADSQGPTEIKQSITFSNMDTEDQAHRIIDLYIQISYQHGQRNAETEKLFNSLVANFKAK